MAKNENYSVVDNVRIYTLDYLMNGDLQEGDLEALLNDRGLKYSLIVNMFKFSEHKLSTQEIINKIKMDNSWLKKYHWTKRQLQSYEEILEKIYYNIYRYSGNELKSNVQWFIIQYGLSVKS